MSVVSDMLSRLVVRATSPDGNVQAKLSGNGFELGFRAKTYPEYSDTGLAAQLSEVLSKLGVGYREAMDKVVTAERGRPPVRGESWDAQQRRYQEARRQLEARGMSPQKYFRTRLTDQTVWTAEVKPGTVAKLSEAEFVAEVKGAVNATIADLSTKEYLLKRDHGKEFRRDLRK